LNRCDTESTSGSQISELIYGDINGVITPRFFYGDVFPGDDGYWLIPNI
jgi:hypothetical protein